MDTKLNNERGIPEKAFGKLAMKVFLEDACIRREKCLNSGARCFR